MRDALEVAACLGIGEHDLADAASVKGAVGPDHVPSEAGCHLVQGALTGTHRLARKLVGVDDGGAMRREHPVDGALAGGDAPGDTDQSHRRGPYSCNAMARREISPSRRPDTLRPSPTTRRH